VSADISKEEYKARLQQYETLVATNPEVDRKGKTMPYTSKNGHMFSLFAKDGTLNLRLPKEKRESFLEEFSTELTVQYGTVMKEYVVVPDELLADTPALKEYFDISYAYVSSLKPKATKKKRNRAA
jgi:TfoX/Sxy family transcriptional regulator of competence genes